MQNSAPSGRFIAAFLLFIAAIVGMDCKGMVLAYTLPDTGQAQCYNNSDVIPCPGPGQPFYGQDATCRGMQPSYRNIADGVVKDQVTGLTWQKVGDGVGRNWEGAGTYCQDLVLGGHADWRLPSRLELLTIVDYGRTFPAMNPIFSCSSGGYWSSSTIEGDLETAWYVYFWVGSASRAHISSLNQVRCVRGGPLPGAVYADHGDTVTDQSTGLVWEKAGSALGMTWEAALAWCGIATTGGFSDWRLPNMREITSLVDDSRINPAIDPVFPEPGRWCWSGSTSVALSYYAWGVQFSNGNDSTNFKENINHVRCVRGGQGAYAPGAVDMLLLNEQ